MNLSTYGANAILDGTAMPATLYVQLHVGNPTAAGTANVAGDNRRVSFTRTAAAAGASENVAVLEWLGALATEDLTHITVWSASSGGNCWWVGAITGAPISATSGLTTEILAGALDLSFAIWA